MRAWIVGVVLICGALAVATLPPEAPAFAFGEVRNDFTPERLRAAELREEVLVAQEALRRRRVLDSLIARVRDVANRPELLVVSAPLDVSDRDRMEAELAALTEDARAELVRLGVARPAVDLGVFTLPTSTRAEAEAVTLLNERRIEWYAGESAGRPYCIALHFVVQPDWGNVRAGLWTREAPLGPNILGPCGFYARHGMPGPAIQKWMEGAGTSLAQSRGAQDYPVEFLPAPETRYFRMRSSTDWGDARVESCLKRSGESCGLLLAEAASSGRGDPLDAIEPRLVALGLPLLESEPDRVQYQSWGAVANSRILDNLERQFGADAFGLFWRSSQPMTVAFEQSFGMTTEAWALAWAQLFEGAEANLVVMPSGREGFLMAFYALVCLRLAVGVATRRRVG